MSESINLNRNLILPSAIMIFFFNFAKGVEQDQSAQTCGLTLLCTLHRCIIIFWKRNAIKIVYYLNFNPFPNKPWFLRICNSSLLKTLWEKEKLLVMSNFSFCHSVFYHFGKPSAIFIKSEIVVCKPFQFGRV